MLIEVVVEAWAHGCCGAAISLGEPAEWTLHAAGPDDAAPSGLPRFVSDEHDTTPDDVPRSRIAGVVRRITGVAYPEIPVIGAVSTFEPDLDHPSRRAITGLAEQESSADSMYLVELEALADAAVLRYGDVAGIARAIERSAITIEPHRRGTASVRWARSMEDEDGISVVVGYGHWWFPATLSAVRDVFALLDAAATGRVAEEVVDLGTGDSASTRSLSTRLPGTVRTRRARRACRSRSRTER